MHHDALLAFVAPTAYSTRYQSLLNSHSLQVGAKRKTK